MNEAERDRTMRFALDRVGAMLPVIATIYGANTDAVAAEAARAEKAGARCFLRSRTQRSTVPCSIPRCQPHIFAQLRVHPRWP